MSEKYIQVGVTALRDPATGGFLPSVPLYIKADDAAKEAEHQVSQEAGQMFWYSHLFQNFPQFIVIHTVKGFDVGNKAEIDVFLELTCFFDDPLVVGNLISDASAFSTSSLNIWKFMGHVLLKPGLENFEHYFANM